LQALHQLPDRRLALLRAGAGDLNRLVDSLHQPQHLLVAQPQLAPAGRNPRVEGGRRVERRVRVLRHLQHPGQPGACGLGAALRQLQPRQDVAVLIRHAGQALRGHGQAGGGKGGLQPRAHVFQPAAEPLCLRRRVGKCPLSLFSGRLSRVAGGGGLLRHRPQIGREAALLGLHIGRLLPHPRLRAGELVACNAGRGKLRAQVLKRPLLRHVGLGGVAHRLPCGLQRRGLSAGRRLSGGQLAPELLRALLRLGVGAGRRLRLLLAPPKALDQALLGTQPLQLLPQLKRALAKLSRDGAAFVQLRK